MNSRLGHSIKHRTYANDEFMTPELLVKNCISQVPLMSRDVVLDSAKGEGAFFNNLPSFTTNLATDDFFNFDTEIDWIISNPPYSELDNWLAHSFNLSRIGVAYLLGLHNITPKRLELANHYGFGITSIHLCKVFHWFGITAFVIWQKDADNILSYDRVVWR